MKRILCFGDSNTYGYNPENGGRYGKDERWTAILQKLSAGKYEIKEAGCNNRTCFRDNFEGKKYTGYLILPDYLAENYDLVILWIGSNDLQRQYNVSEQEIKYGIENLVEIVKLHLPQSKILLIPPVIIGREVLTSRIFSFLFDETSIQKSYLAANLYEYTARKYNCDFLNLGNIIVPSEYDGLHFEAGEHKKIANAVYNKIDKIFKNV